MVDRRRVGVWFRILHKSARTQDIFLFLVLVARVMCISIRHLAQGEWESW